MQSAAGRRAISTLAAKLHPPTPLTPQESKQLLNLLTTNFRDHLDREHPVKNTKVETKSKSLIRHYKSSTPEPPPSSYTHAHDHIESILSNPLLSTKPIPKDKANNAVRLLEDPVSWFTNEVALGTADIQKATLCLQMSRDSTVDDPKKRATRDVAPVIADWLRTSGMDKTSQFLDSLFPGKPLPDQWGPLVTLIPILMQNEKTQAYLWRWLARSPETRRSETGSSAERILTFRSLLLREMGRSSNFNESLALFLSVFEWYKTKKHDIELRMIQSLGSHLVGRVERDAHSSSADIYEAFINSIPSWSSSWSKPVEAMLWMCHPTKPAPYPALDVIENFDSNFKLSHSRQKFIVRLSLGAAQQLLDLEKTVEAQLALDFTRKHFGDLVLPKAPRNRRVADRSTKHEEETWGTELLDRLLPT